MKEGWHKTDIRLTKALPDPQSEIDSSKITVSPLRFLAQDKITEMSTLQEKKITIYSV